MNIDFSILLRIACNPIVKSLAPMVLDRGRLDKLRSLDANVMCHDLRRGIPFPAESVDAVYHSHVLEHIDRESAKGFLQEIYRVLKTGGVHRLAVPDLERLARSYLRDFEYSGNVDWREHDRKVAETIEQMVRREAWGSARQGALRRRLENFLLGDARKRGETHQWMYDRINLRGLLEECGFREIEQADFRTSRIPDWQSIGLDTTDDGAHEYKPESIYFECLR